MSRRQTVALFIAFWNVVVANWNVGLSPAGVRRLRKFAGLRVPPAEQQQPRSIIFKMLKSTAIIVRSAQRPSTLIAAIKWSTDYESDLEGSIARRRHVRLIKISRWWAGLLIIDALPETQKWKQLSKVKHIKRKKLIILFQRKSSLRSVISAQKCSSISRYICICLKFTKWITKIRSCKYFTPFF